jgi:hypothetical protein
MEYAERRWKLTDTGRQNEKFRSLSVRQGGAVRLQGFQSSTRKEAVRESYS